MEITIENVPSEPMIGVVDSVSDMSQISAKLGAAYEDIMKFVEQNKLEYAGYPFAVTTAYSENSWSFIAGIAVKSAPEQCAGRVIVGKTPSGKAVKGVALGSYAQMQKYYEEVLSYIKANNLEICGNSWEVYLNDPNETPEDQLITWIYFPVK